MKAQRSSLGASMRKSLPSPHPRSTLSKPQSCHHSPKLSSTLTSPSKSLFSRGKALELLLQEDLKNAKLMGRRSEVAAVGRVLEAVMERSQEFKSVLGLVQKRYEAMIESAASETESAQLALEKQHEEKRQLLKRIDALSYENSQLKGQGDRPPRPPTSPKALYDSTERLAAWGKVHHSHHQSIPEGKVVIPRLNLGLIGQPQSPAVKREPIYIEDM